MEARVFPECRYRRKIQAMYPHPFIPMFVHTIVAVRVLLSISSVTLGAVLASGHELEQC